MSFSQWFWPALAVLLAILWLYTALNRRRAAPATRPPGPAPADWPVEAEDVLKAAYVLQPSGATCDRQELARSVGLPESLGPAVAAALVASDWGAEDAQGGLHLTAAGQARAQELIRAHRLWERYLVDREGMPLEAVHAEAHRREHETTPEGLEQLDAELGHPAWDPHGHAIPAPGHSVPSSSGRPLLEASGTQRRLRIVSLDDEPAPLLAQLVILGLRPGVDVEVLERLPHALQIRVNGSMVSLAAAAAEHIFVVPAPVLPIPMGKLEVGAQGRVVEVSGSGKHQRRMLDMGFVPGAEVNVIRRAPLGDPVEYGIKGTAVALRQTDADTILVEETNDG